MMLPGIIAQKAVTLKDQYFDLKGLSIYSALSVNTLRHHIRLNGLPAYAVSGKILIRKGKFDTWISKFRITRKQDLDAIVDSVIGLRSRR